MASRKDSKGRALRKGESERKDGRYQFRFEVNGDRQSVYATTLNELREKEKQIEKDSYEGINSKIAQVTVSEMFDSYLESKMKLRDTTRHLYQFVFDHHVRGRIGNIPLQRIDTSSIRKLYHDIYKKDKVSVSTLKTVHTFLSPIFGIAVSDDAIKKNYDKEAWKQVTKDINFKTKEKPALEESTQKRFVEFLRNNPEYWNQYNFIDIMLSTGVRVGELAALRWNDCDFKKGFISVDETMFFIPRYGRGVNDPKTEAGNRKIPMFESTKRILLQQKERAFASGHAKPNDYVFMAKQGGMLSHTTIHRRVKVAAEKFNAFEIEAAIKEDRDPELIDYISPHVLRHTFCTRLCESDVNIKTIQSVMGHSDAEITLNVYAKISNKKNQSAFDRLEQISIF